MPIVTLISDLGTKDFYLAAVKGTILSAAPQTQLVDISHEIPPFDLLQASFNLRNAWSHFPAGTIHLIGIEDSGNVHARNLAVLYKEHIFIGTDNSIFSMIFEEDPTMIVEIQIGAEDGNLIFAMRDILAKAAGFLANGGNLEILGPKVDSFLVRPVFMPVVADDILHGKVIYIDGYGNVFTNITRKDFDQFVGQKNYAIYFTQANHPIRKISTHYDEVHEGERLAIFSSTGYLQIAINRGVHGAGGGASQLFGLKVHNSIRIELE